MKTQAMKWFGYGLCLALVAATVSGCKGKKNPPLETDLTGSDTTDSNEYSSGDGLPDIDPTRLSFEKDSSLSVVYFDYDSSALRPDALSALSANANTMKQNPGYYYQIEGHCDERGTQEYNIALGERRALAVRDHLMKLGVSGDRMITISYGEEVPAVIGSNESAWAKNCRAEFGRSISPR